MSLKVSAILPARPVHEPGSRTEKSPARMVCKQAENYAQVRRDCFCDQTRVSIVLGRFGIRGYRCAGTVAPFHGRLLTSGKNLQTVIGLDLGPS